MEYNFENKFVETDETIIFFDNYINVDNLKSSSPIFVEKRTFSKL